jgi:hypothetical protein
MILKYTTILEEAKEEDLEEENLEEEFYTPPRSPSKQTAWNVDQS